MSKKISKDEILEKAYASIDNDRATITSVIMQLHKTLSENEANHKEYGMVFSKYLEAASRSNQQFLDILDFMRHANKDEMSDLTSSDKEDILDQIQEESNRERESKK
jgi:hypothetical protein